MEKLINRRNILFAITSLLIISSIIFYFFINSQNKNEKYFDIILAELYNEEVQDYDDKLNFCKSYLNEKNGILRVSIAPNKISELVNILVQNKILVSAIIPKTSLEDLYLSKIGIKSKVNA